MNSRMLNMWPLIVTMFIVAARAAATEKEESSTEVDIPLTFTTQEGENETTDIDVEEGEEISEQRWISILQKLFLKWGYTIDQVPEPFGTKKFSEIILSPEFSIILRALEKSVPSEDLRGQIEAIVEEVQDDGDSSDASKLQEIKGTIEGILGRDGENEVSKSKKFCAETEGPCENENSLASMTYEDSLKLDEQTLEKLLTELKEFLEKKPPSWNSNEIDKSNYNLIKVIRLIHEIESIAEKALAMSKQMLSTEYPPQSSDNQEEIEEVSTFTETSDGLATREDLVAQKMKEGDEVVDTSIVGNVRYEVGRHMGKIASNRAQSLSEVSSKEDDGDNPKVEIDSQVKTSNLETLFNNLDMQTLNLTSLLNADQAHENHKKNAIELIRKLKITGEKEQDKEKISKIEQLVEEIDKEHHKAIELEKKLNQLRSGKVVTHRKRGGRRRQQQRKNSIVEEKTNVSFEKKHQDDKSELQISQKGKEWNGQQKFLVKHGRKKLRLDKLTVEPSEVNLNGGFEESVDNLKAKFPNGHWPESDAWLEGEPRNHAITLERIVGPNPRLQSEQAVQNDGEQYQNLEESQPMLIHFISDDQYQNQKGDEYYEDDSTNYESQETENQLPDKSQQKEDLIVLNLQEEIGAESESQENFDPLNPKDLEKIIRAHKLNGNGEKKHHVQEHGANPKLSEKRSR